MTDQPNLPLDDAHRRTLLELARNAITHRVTTGKTLTVTAGDYPDELRPQRATFVTLERGGKLRGCIGMLQAVRPLVEDVAANAQAAAVSDPRFTPMTRPELENLDIHISILSPPSPMTFASEADLLGQLRPGVDGLIIAEGNLRGTFLPSVWESLPEPALFLRQLKRKAGLLDEYWSKSVRAWRYTTESIH